MTAACATAIELAEDPSTGRLVTAICPTRTDWVADVSTGATAPADCPMPICWLAIAFLSVTTTSLGSGAWANVICPKAPNPNMAHHPVTSSPLRYILALGGLRQQQFLLHSGA